MPTIFSEISPDDAEAIVALACSLDSSPGSNWVQKEGGLPDYICRIAKAIKKTGKTTSQAIAIAVSRVKVWASGKGVDGKTQAKAAAAVAQWEKLKGKAHADNKVAASNTDLNDLYEIMYNMLAEVDDLYFDDTQLALAATFEDCTPKPLGQIVALSRTHKEFVALSVLTSKTRAKLSASDFAIPETRKYPIQDEKHAKNALARVAQHGTPEEKKKVRAAVKRRYPDIDVADV